MRIIYLLIGIYFSYVTSAPQYEIIYGNNGWIPLTKEQVYNRVRPILKEDIYSTTEKTVTQTVFEDVKHNIVNCYQTNANTCLYTKIKQPYLLEQDNIPNQFMQDTNITSSQIVRRSKKIPDIVFQNKHFDKTNDVIVSKDELERAYEVTESHLHDFLPEEAEHGFDYESPNVYTNTLLNVLSKYNIKVDDDLPNYSVSRQQKALNPLPQEVAHKLYSFGIPHRYNSLNHMPVDPLLAVFLSNYGFYLQGRYGIHNNYNNLYGYLASNNIHNNRPFGMYKIFSDTDSSN